MIAMIVIGCLLIPVYCVWDLKFAKFPVIAHRFLHNRTVVLAALIGCFDFVSNTPNSGIIYADFRKYLRSRSTFPIPISTPS